MDSDTAAESDRSVRKKRPYTAVSTSELPNSGSDTETGSKIAATTNTNRRSGKPTGRGRGHGLARAKAELKRMETEAKEETFDMVLRSRAFRKEIPLPALETGESSTSEVTKEPTKLGAEELRAAAGRNAAMIVEVAQKAGNLKGQTIKKLKDSAAALQEIVDTLAARTEAEETRQLRLDNGRLRRELENLKAELKAYRREFTQMKAAAKDLTANTPIGEVSAIEELKGAIISSIGLMMDARFAGIEDRLLPATAVRPPLATDKKRATKKTSRITSETQPMQMEALPSENQVKSNQQTTMIDTETRAETNQDNSWATVVSRKRAKKQPLSVTTSKVAPMGKTQPPNKPNLALPRSAAIIITLQPDAAEKGVTYAQVLERAEQSINLQELGIGAGMRIRQAATGARLLELPKEQKQEQADLLAEKLRTALEGVANVIRPIKYVELKLTGLDDSVTKIKVAGAVAQAGKCPIEAVKVGEVKPGPGGMGMVIVRCPTVAAKELSHAGRVLVGWSSARIQVLEQRPMRCYKCLGIGHTRPLCPSSVDRSGLCFRCGHEGHKASDCTGPLRCALCLDTGRPHGHIMGGRDCNPPPSRGKVGKTAEAAPNDRRQQVPEETEMVL